MTRIALLLFALWPAFAAGADPAAPLHHRLTATLHPDQGELLARDAITLDTPRSELEFDLHAALTPVVEAGELALLGPVQGADWRRWRARFDRPVSTLTVSYRGRLQAPPADTQALHATEGHIGPEGVFLDGGSGWYPILAGEPSLTFELSLKLPEGWRGVSQGRATAAGWSESQPQRHISLAANRYHEWRRATPAGEAQVWLLADDPALAERYLAATERYLQLYSRLIGPYPYAKFALVENFWESGYGFPSFTLLGGRVLRLPFIVDSSYPHEVLHNWWGNGVYPDYPHGNWSEGLTAYLADHLLAEQRGEGENWRRDQLKKFAEYAASAQQMPLTAFRSRHGEASQAVGYGKAALTFHMLRVALGDEQFRAGLRELYGQWRFRVASWEAVRTAFEKTAGRSLAPFFHQWVERAGAPALALSDVAATDGEVVFTLAQTQEGPPYRMEVPWALLLQDGRVQEGRALLEGARQELRVSADGAVAELRVDPRFDLFRRLDPGELPPAFDRLFARGRPVFVLPAAARPELLAAWRSFAEALGRGQGELVLDGDLDAQRLARLAAERPVWLLGWENRFRSEAVVPGDVTLAENVKAAGAELPRAEAAVALATARFGLVLCDDPRALRGLARKLPHYGKYGLLLFRGAAPDNVGKGEWPTSGSPLWHRFAPQAEGRMLPPRPWLGAEP